MNHGEGVFPIPLVTLPLPPSSRSSRLRHRFRKRLALSMAANALLTSLNSLYAGNLRRAHPCRRLSTSVSLKTAWAQTAALALKECQRFAKERRELNPPTGVHAAATLAKTSARDQYSLAPGRDYTQVRFSAELLDEPSGDDVVDMLSALPLQEAEHYSREDLVVSEMASMTTSMAEIEQQYAFVGGTMAEYAKYFLRADLPRDMWTWGGRFFRESRGWFCSSLEERWGAPTQAANGVLPKFCFPPCQHTSRAWLERRRGPYPFYVRRPFVGRGDA